MIHVVNCSNRHLYRAQIWSMYQERKRIYVDGHGWTELMSFDGAEVDDFDDERAVYLMALGPTGELWGAQRVRPTDDRCILVDKFPHLIGPGQPQLKGPEAWESTRIFSVQNYRGSTPLFPLLATAGVEVALDAGARRIVAFTNVENYPHMTNGAAEFHLTGLPHRYRYGVMVGMRLEIDEQALQRLRDSVAQFTRLSYEVDDEDIEVHGSLAAVQQAVDKARMVDDCACRQDVATPITTIARIEAQFAKHDGARLVRIADFARNAVTGGSRIETIATGMATRSRMG
jgi:N-acyl-L-homoserine lactone synthetase